MNKDLSADLKARALNDDINIAEEVKQLVESSAWQKYIEPLFDDMITDILGGKDRFGRYTNGLLNNRQIKEVRLRELQAYKAALINLHSAIYDMVDGGDIARAQIAHDQFILEEQEASMYEFPRGDEDEYA